MNVLRSMTTDSQAAEPSLATDPPQVNELTATEPASALQLEAVVTNMKTKMKREATSPLNRASNKRIKIIKEEAAINMEDTS